jgi:hypothetical protein
VVGGMFAVATMNSWGERFTEVGTEFGLFETVPWCAMQLERRWRWLWHKLD